MRRFSDLIGPESFAIGILTYTDRFGTDQAQNTRIVVTLQFGSRLISNAVIDTGALWCILNPEKAEQIAPHQKEQLGTERLIVRGLTYTGHLFRIPVTVIADEGSDLIVDATVFVPVLQEDEQWLHPNFLGLDGFLDRLRFAVDPAENAFYFGPIVN